MWEKASTSARLTSVVLDDPREHPRDPGDQMHEVPGVGVVVINHDHVGGHPANLLRP